MRQGEYGLAGSYRGYRISTAMTHCNQYGGTKKAKLVIYVDGKQQKFKNMNKLKAYVDQLIGELYGH